MVHLIAPDDFDPDDALEAMWLREHDGAPALEIPHPEEEARDIVLSNGHWLPVRLAYVAFDQELDTIENGGSNDFPF
jgi:hypothetical protein